MKEKNKTPGKQLNETEITSLSDAELKTPSDQHAQRTD